MRRNPVRLHVEQLEPRLVPTMPSAAPPLGPPPSPGPAVIWVDTIAELQSAVRNLQSDQTIVVEPGTYNLTETLVVGRGSQVTNVTIRGATDNFDDVIIRGRGMDNPSYGSVPHGIAVYNALDVTIANLAVGDVYYHPIDLQGIQGADRVHLYHLHIFDGGEQLIKSNPGNGGVDDVTVEYSLVEYTNGTPTTNHGPGIGYTDGISAHEADNWIIRNSVFRNFHTPDGVPWTFNPVILMWNYSSNTLVEGNTFINSDRAIALGFEDKSGFDHQGGIIRNNFIYQAPGLFSASRRAGADAQILVNDSPNTQVYNNTILTNLNSPLAIEVRWGSGVAVRNNLMDAPIGTRNGGVYASSNNFAGATPAMFVDPATADLHLLVNAATQANVIDRGGAIAGLTNDWDINSRPQGSAVDIGADEVLPVLPAPPTLIDNGQPGYSQAGPGWFAWTGGYASTISYAAAGSGANTASWQASGLAAGTYDVQMTWVATANRATNAAYQVYDGNTLLTTVLVNQRLTPSGGAVVDGTPFQGLGQFSISSGTLKVILSDNANGFVIADALRATALTVDLSWTGGSLTVPATVTTLTPFTLNRTYTISGGAADSDFVIGYYASRDATFGNADDVLLGTETITAAPDKTVGTHSGTSPSLQFSGGGTFYLFAQLDRANVVNETDEANNVLAAPQAVVVVVTGPTLIDNGQSGYSETGSGWGFYSGVGYNDNFSYAAAGSGANTATWQASGLAAASYEVQVTWWASANRASNAKYQVYDGTTLLATVVVNQQPAPAGGPVIGGRPFQSLGLFTINSGTLKVVLTDDANGYVIADAMRAAPAPPPATDLNWTGGSLSGPGTATPQAPFTLSRTYNISGATAPGNFAIAYYASTDTTFGNADDVLLGTESITAAADKTVGTHTGTSPSLQFGSGGTYYLFAELDRANALNESDEANNVLAAPQAVVVVVTGPTLIDNGQSGYSETGSGWGFYSGVGYNDNFSYAAAGSGANTATWQASGLAAASYDVQVTWWASANRASNAKYQVYDGTTLLATVVVNQQPAPAGGPVIGGRPFQSLGQFTISSGTLKVVLSDDANGYVIADAMRAVPAPPPATDLNWTGGSLSGPGTATTQTPFTLSRTYNISGGTATGNFAIAYYASTDTTFGNADDVLLGTESITAAADKTVGTHTGTSPSLQFGSGGTYYLFAELDRANALNESDEANNVLAAPQALAVTGPTLIDNGQAGYSENGSGWGFYSGVGYNDNFGYAAAGSGANTATWQASGLAAASYDVQVTWWASANRATNAKYQVYDGTTLLATVVVNQRLTPTGGAVVAGTPFQSLGQFGISNGTLKVVLSDDADGYVIADALRVALA